MAEPEDFPPMVLVGVDNSEGGEIASLRELTPMFHRPPDRVWAECYRIECERSPLIDWQGADFALCEVGGETVVIEALREATAAADRRFIAHLKSSRSPGISDIVAVEQISARSVGSDGPYLLPFGPPGRTY